MAQTLNKLGEFTSDCENWKQSEEYFREAVDILKDTANDKQQLSAIRMKLINVLEKQGDFKQVVTELQDLKENFEHSATREKFDGLLDKIQLKIRKSIPDQSPKTR